MIVPITLVLVGLTSIHAESVPYPYSGSLKSAPIPQANIVSTSQNGFKHYNPSQQASYVGVSPTPQSIYSAVPSAPQAISYSAIPSTPQAVSYNAAPSAPQQAVAYSAVPSAVPYSAVPSTPQAVPYNAVPSVPQAGPYVALSSGPQPTPYVAVSPKFLSAPAPAALAVPAVPVATPKFAPLAQAKSGIADKDAQIVNEGREVGYDGSFNYGFETENGISVKSKGYIKPAVSPTDEPIQVIEGSYTYFDAYGKPQTIQYIADENGYRAFGEAIPQPPEEILKTLAHRR